MESRIKSQSILRQLSEVVTVLALHLFSVVTKFDNISEVKYHDMETSK